MSKIATLQKIMNKAFQILLLLSFSAACFAQNREITKLRLSFTRFKSYDAEFSLDLQSQKLTVVMFDNLKHESFRREYAFTEIAFTRLRKAVETDIPISEIIKIEEVLDGGGFTLTYFFKKGESTKLTVINPNRSLPKYRLDFEKIDAFFEFAYSIVKDDGIAVLDNSYESYFTGIPIRKMSDSPLEYRLWGNVSGNLAANPAFFKFLDNLPKNQCVIIDANEKLSYALQNEILVRYVIKNSNVRFANMRYLKNTREYILKIRPEIKAAIDNGENLDIFKRKMSASAYLTNPELMDKWLELPEEIRNKSISELRKDCR